MGALMDKINELPDESVKYAQQHLANERTYLAWLRTAVSIIGVGFLTTSLHFTIKISTNHFINNVAIFLGIFACIVGTIIVVISTTQYTRKREEIQKGIFNPAHNSIIFTTILFSILVLIIFIYLSILLFM
ncbi:YidH family protein [Bacillus sp. FSL K6-3431]|uniref:YidH family protein n=1 Tax=Bacillus sp. FSL K6-3431 TaxID=2921500 RepID=UPI0030F79C93